nr:atrial natriuretic peptide receptor 1-like [Biomphalaria glabrata]
MQWPKHSTAYVNPYITQHNIISSSGDPYITQHNIISSSGDPYITQHNIISSSGDHYITQHNIISSSGDPYKTQHNIISSSGDHYITQHNIISSSGDHYITQHNIISSSDGSVTRMGTMWISVCLLLWSVLSVHVVGNSLTGELPLCDDAVNSRHRANKIRIGVILPFNVSVMWRLQVTRPALERARDYIQLETNLLKNFSIEFDYRDSNCSEINGPLEGIDMYTKGSVDVFLGPGCDYSIAPLARFTGAWGIPIMSAGALVWDFRDKSLYQLLTRVQGSYEKASEFFTVLAKHFNYTNFGIVSEEEDDLKNGKTTYWFVSEAMFFLLKERVNPNISIAQNVHFIRGTPKDVDTFLVKLSKSCRALFNLLKALAILFSL